MTFDFDTIIDRRFTDSTKHNRYKDTNILPMWVADMDFRSPPAIIEALADRVQHGIYGYTQTPAELVEVIRARLLRLYDWQILAEDLVFMPGVVPGLNIACRAFTAPNEAVLTTTPIYPPFVAAPEYCGRELKKVEAIHDEGRWHFPVDGLAAAAKGNARLLLLCNPYNPVGRALGREELAEVVDLCLREDLIICSDEIHCDLMFDGRKHVPTATLGGDAADITVTLLAPSKSFNLAGFGGSFAVIQNPGLRERFKHEMRGIVPNLTIMAYVSMLAAYRDSNDWLQALIDYLQGNRDYLYQALDHVPGISMNHVEATYLAWLDVSGLELDDPPAFFEAAGVGMSEGYRYGDRRFMRLNFGCSRSVVAAAVDRIEAAVSR
ncbi:MAG: PatB family C-S lyase [Pseudomonadales bacterium]